MCHHQPASQMDKYFHEKWPAERCACLKTFSSTQALCIVLVVCVCTCNCKRVSLFVCSFGCQPLSQPNSYYIYFFHKLNKSQQKVTGLSQTKGISNSTGTLFWLTVCVMCTCICACTFHSDCVRAHICMHTFQFSLCIAISSQKVIVQFTISKIHVLGNAHLFCLLAIAIVRDSKPFHGE